MVVKTITVTEEAYKALKRMKGNEESFSETILKFSKDKGSMMKYFGILPKENIKGVRKRMQRIREEVSRDIDKHVRS